MIFKFPKEQKALSAELREKLGKLSKEKRDEWFVKFDDCVPDKVLYENLLKDVKKGVIHANTVQDQKYLEEQISRKETELMLMLNEQPDKSEVKIAEEKTSLLSRQGSVNIRPQRGTYSPPKVRK